MEAENASKQGMGDQGVAKECGRRCVAVSNLDNSTVRTER
jgi:hypothetical protein